MLPVPHYQDDSVTLYHGDCIDVMRAMPDCSVDSITTDPPYGLGFMGKGWDDLPPGLPWAIECLRVLKPGGYLLAFGGSRTWHRLACAVEDAGFEMRDSIAWIYASGFPKSLNVNKAAPDLFCGCQAVPYNHDGFSGLRGVRDDVSDAGVLAETEDGADLFASVQRGAPGARVGDARTQGLGGGQGTEPAVRGRESGMEGRGDLPPREGELRRPAIRPMPAGSADDGAQGRIHHGAPASHGPLDRSPDAANGSGEPHQPRPTGQSPGEPGDVPEQRGSQAWRGWPVCERCAKPVIPAGLGTALKPAFEPIVMGRKPLVGTVAANVLVHGTGALNVDGCRVGPTGESRPRVAEASQERRYTESGGTNFAATPGVRGGDPAGRWPTNVILDESQAAELDRQTGVLTSGKMRPTHTTAGVDGRASAFGKDAAGGFTTMETYGDSGGASRFFPVFRYEAKAPAHERPRVQREDGTWEAHATVKPLDLMRWLVRLVTPPGGVVLEPFAGSGTTAEACVIEGFQCIAIEREAAYLPLIVARLSKPIAVAFDLGGAA